MKRSKPPALTSPWKIGFFVSLLLVAVSIGVGYFITRAFEVPWSWVEFPDGSWRSWSFHIDGFMREMLPIVVVVPVFSLFSFFLIAGAVRKYKAYLDSGLDYKNLVRSIRRIQDLQDEKPIKKLNNHPELREFLLNLRSRIAEREKALDEKEKALVETSRAEANESIREEVNILISAFASGHDGFQGELSLANQQLKDLEVAIREYFSVDDSAQAVANEMLASARDAVRDDAQSFIAQFHEIRSELASCSDDARELESQANRAKADVSAASANAGGARTVEVAQALGGLDTITKTLTKLGEEAKGVAINSATRAASAGNSEMVEFAESLRDIAVKFSAAAEQWTQSSSTVRQTLEAGANDSGGNADHAVQSLASQISMWVERTVVLTEKFRDFETQYENSTTALDVQLGGEVSVDGSAHAEAPDTAHEEMGVDVEGLELVDDFVRQTPDRILSDDMSIEKDPDSVVDVLPEEDSDDGMFEEIGADDEYVDEFPEPAPAPEIDVEDEYVDETPEPEPSFAEDDGIVTDPAVASQDIDEQSAPVELEPMAFQSTTMDADSDAEDAGFDGDGADADVVDLYALGAVDYVQGAHP